MRVVIVGEGKSELGKFWADRDLLEIVPQARLGALEILMSRLSLEVYGIQLEILGLPRLPPTRPGNCQRASLTGVIQDPELLKKVVYPCFVPARRELLPFAAEAAIITCDAELHTKVAAAVSVAKQYVASRMVHITFEPEFEALLLDKAALEQATGVQPCSIRIPDGEEIQQAGGVKEALRRCVQNAGYAGEPRAGSSSFLVKVVLELGNDFLKGGNTAFRSFRDRLEALFRP